MIVPPPHRANGFLEVSVLGPQLTAPGQVRALTLVLQTSHTQTLGTERGEGEGGEKEGEGVRVRGVKGGVRG